MKTNKSRVRSQKKVSLERILSPFKNPNNQKIFAGTLILIALYLLIAFISFFFDWKADDSIVSGKKLGEIITNDNINNTIGGFGAYIANLYIQECSKCSGERFVEQTLVSMRGMQFANVVRINMSTSIHGVCVFICRLSFHDYSRSLCSPLSPVDS